MEIWYSLTDWEVACIVWAVIGLAFVLITRLPDSWAGGKLLERKKAPSWAYFFSITTAALGQVGGRMSHNSRLIDAAWVLLLLIAFTLGRSSRSWKLSLPARSKRSAPPAHAGDSSSRPGGIGGG